MYDSIRNGLSYCFYKVFPKLNGANIFSFCSLVYVKKDRITGALRLSIGISGYTF